MLRLREVYGAGEEPAQTPIRHQGWAFVKADSGKSDLCLQHRGRGFLHRSWLYLNGIRQVGEAPDLFARGAVEHDHAAAPHVVVDAIQRLLSGLSDVQPALQRDRLQPA
mgnify:CR=1 FL=1